MAGIRIGGIGFTTGIVAYSKDFFDNGSFDEWRQIWQVPQAGGTPAAVTTQTTNGTIDTDPQVSPGGTQVVFLRATGFGTPSLWVVNANGSGEDEIDSGACVAPMWHPDGSVILYRIGSGFYTIQPDGTNKTNVSPDATPPSGTYTPVYPTWNEDGSQIAFLYDFTSGAVVDELWVCAADGTGAVKLSDASLGGIGGFGVSWLHATDTILFTERIAGVNQLSRIESDGSGKTQLTSGSIGPALTKFAVPADDSAAFTPKTNGGSPWPMNAVALPSGPEAALSPALNGNATVGRGQAFVFAGRVYTIRSSDQSLVSVLPDGSDERVEDTPATGAIDETLFLGGNGTQY